MTRKTLNKLKALAWPAINFSINAARNLIIRASGFFVGVCATLAAIYFLKPLTASVVSRYPMASVVGVASGGVVPNIAVRQIPKIGRAYVTGAYYAGERFGQYASANALDTSNVCRGITFMYNCAKSAATCTRDTVSVAANAGISRLNIRRTL